MRLCDSFMCAALIISGSPWSVIVSWLQSNWYASPGAKLIGTNACAGTRARSSRHALHEPVHAVVRAVIAAPAQLLEQTLRRAAFPPRQLGFLLQDLGQNLDPLAQLRRRLHAALVLELGRLAADHLAHRRARHRQRPHDLLDRTMLLEIGPPDLAR